MMWNAIGIHFSKYGNLQKYFFLANLNLSVNFQKITRTASEILAKALKMGLFTKSELGQNEASTESGDTNKDTPGMFAS